MRGPSLTLCRSFNIVRRLGTSVEHESVRIACGYDYSQAILGRRVLFLPEMTPSSKESCDSAEAI